MANKLALLGRKVRIRNRLIGFVQYLLGHRSRKEPGTDVCRRLCIPNELRSIQAYVAQQEFVLFRTSSCVT
jgi:hypothetical protein